MKIIFLTLLVFFFFTIKSLAINRDIVRNDFNNWGRSTKYSKTYELKNTETIRGEILNIEEVHSFRGVRSGIHLLIESIKGRTWVYLGPSWYIINQNLKFKIADVVDVTGFRFFLGGKHGIVAREIAKENEYLTLRDESGIPSWCSSCKEADEVFTERLKSK
jgi:hypothetical protein